MDFPDIQAVPRVHDARKKTFWRILICVLAVLFCLYSIVWYLLSNHLQKWIEDYITGSLPQGITLYCENLHKTGFPLRIGGACEAMNYQWPTAGIAFSSNGLIASSPIFAPQWRSIQVVSPANFAVPGLLPIGANWEKLQIDSKFKHGSIRDIELRAHAIDMSNFTENREEIALLKADFVHLVTRIKADAMHLDLTYDQLLLPFFVTSDQTQLPAVDGKARIRLNKPSHLLLPIVGAWSNRLRSMTGRIESANISFENGGQFILSGDFSFSKDGYLDGNFQVAFVNLNDLSRVLRRLYPSQSSNIRSFFFVLNSLPKDSTGNPIVYFDVKHGIVSTLVFQLGQIPPV